MALALLSPPLDTARLVAADLGKASDEALVLVPLFAPYVAEQPVEHAIAAGFDERGRLRSFVDLPGAVDCHHGLMTAVRAAIAPADVRYLVLAHNHVIGDEQPSSADREATRIIAALCRLANVRLDDHLILARDSICSMAALGLL